MCVVILPAESWDSLNRAFVQVNYPSRPRVFILGDFLARSGEKEEGTPTGMTRLSASSSISGDTNCVSIFLLSRSEERTLHPLLAKLRTRFVRCIIPIEFLSYNLLLKCLSMRCIEYILFFSLTNLIEKIGRRVKFRRTSGENEKYFKDSKKTDRDQLNLSVKLIIILNSGTTGRFLGSRLQNFLAKTYLSLVVVSLVTRRRESV